MTSETGPNGFRVPFLWLLSVMLTICLAALLWSAGVVASHAGIEDKMGRFVEAQDRMDRKAAILAVTSALQIKEGQHRDLMLSAALFEVEKTFGVQYARALRQTLIEPPRPGVIAGDKG